ncbi:MULTISPECIES: hypothetical protein [Vibrio]|uniref:Porin family protein n=1 Tax=Vibrio casei TaxID=673372 RepID=A0A368LKG8_9VIBR|nr:MULTISPECIES: hypothetical protein [Vibrio]RCS72285.1 hypothetical protein CIK83_00935 [Vibrio casei]SJN29996.1 hypothetical protein FM109_09455 [Vibrio casei]HBV77961.1 hypothetical protein [Vibrio sp.]
MFILLFSLLSYWSGTPITSLTNPDYREYNSPYNYTYLQIGAGLQQDGENIDLGGSYMLNDKLILTMHYQNQFLQGGDLPNGHNAYDSKFNQSVFSLGSMYRLPINTSLDVILGGGFSYDWYKDRNSSSTTDQIVGLDYDNKSIGINSFTGVRYSLTHKLELGADIGMKYAYHQAYLQASSEINYYFTENIALGSKASYDDHDGHIGFYIRITQ